MAGDWCPGYVDVVVYCDDRTDLQADETLRRVHDQLTGIETKVQVNRRSSLPCTLVTLTWVDVIE